MKVTQFLVLGAFLGTVSALSPAEAQAALSGLPDCAMLCSASIVPRSDCDVTDMACVCASEPLTQEIGACVASSCTVKEALTATNITFTVCERPVRDGTYVQEAILVFGTVIGFGAAILRLIARPPWSDQFGGDDVFFLLTITVAIAGTVLTNYLIAMGLGKDIWTIEFDDITKIFEMWYAMMITYNWILTTTKLSMLCFYLRVFPERGFRRLVYLLMALCVCFGVTFIIVAIFQCAPVPYFWTMWSGNIVLDFIIIALPIRPLLKLSCSRRQKIQILAMFSCGFFITISSMIRLHILNKFKNSANITWDYASVAYWSGLELHVSIVCICMPAIALLYRQTRAKWLGVPLDSRGTEPSTTTSSSSSGKRGWYSRFRGSAPTWFNSSSSSSNSDSRMDSSKPVASHHHHRQWNSDEESGWERKDKETQDQHDSFEDVAAETRGIQKTWVITTQVE